MYAYTIMDSRQTNMAWLWEQYPARTFSVMNTITQEESYDLEEEEGRIVADSLEDAERLYQAGVERGLYSPGASLIEMVGHEEEMELTEDDFLEVIQ